MLENLTEQIRNRTEEVNDKDEEEEEEETEPKQAQAMRNQFCRKCRPAFSVDGNMFFRPSRRPENRPDPTIRGTRIAEWE